MALTSDEVDYAFRMILGRPPESDTAIDFHISKFADLKSLRNHLFNTAEFRKSFWQRLAEGDPDIGRKDAHFASEKTVFLHIPKNAGTTMNRLLDQLFSESDVFPHQSLISHYPAYFIAKHRLFRGHYTLQEIQYIPGPKVILTLLREPRLRILSQYHYHKSVKISETAVNDLPMVHKARMPLRDYLQDETVRQHVSVDNMQTRYLFYLSPEAAKRVGFRGSRSDNIFDTLPRKVAVEIAKENLQRIDFVGLVEEFDKFVQLFWAERAINLPLDYRPQNVTRDLARVDPKSHAQVAFEQADEEIHHLLDDLVELDEELYRFGANLFRQRFQEWTERTGSSVGGPGRIRAPVVIRGVNGSNARQVPVDQRHASASPVHLAAVPPLAHQKGSSSTAQFAGPATRAEGAPKVAKSRAAGDLAPRSSKSDRSPERPAVAAIRSSKTGARGAAKLNGHEHKVGAAERPAAASKLRDPASVLPEPQTRSAPSRTRRSDRKIPETSDH